MTGLEEPGYVRKPALTVALAAQPEVLEDYLKPGLRQGINPRFMFSPPIAWSQKYQTPRHQILC